MKEGLEAVKIDIIIFQILIMIYLFTFGAYLGKVFIILMVIIISVNLIFVIFLIEKIHKKILSEREIKNRLLMFYKGKDESLQHMLNIKELYIKGDKEGLLNYIVKSQREYNDDLIICNLEILNIILKKYIFICKRNNIKFTYKLEKDISNIIKKTAITPEELCTILGNLLDNSVDILFRKLDNKEIFLRIEKKDFKVIISVSNNGDKLRESIKGKMFNLGFSTKSNNRGMGLFIVSKLVSSLGAVLDVYSTDKETRFELILDVLEKNNI